MDKAEAQLDAAANAETQAENPIENVIQMVSDLATMTMLMNEDFEGLNNKCTCKRLALEILNDHYAKAGNAHNSYDGAGIAIIGMLAVIESDLE